MIRIYIYIDDVFHYKTEIFEQNNCPVFDVNLSLNIAPENQEVRLDVYDASLISE